MALEFIEKSKFLDLYTKKVDEFIDLERSALFGNVNTDTSRDWVSSTQKKLKNFYTNSDRYVAGSSAGIGVAVTNFLPEISLITGRQILDLEQNRDDLISLLGPYSVDFGVGISGRPYDEFDRILFKSFSDNQIPIGKGKIIDFSQLNLFISRCGTLALKLKEDVRSIDVANISDYPNLTNSRGVFGAHIGNVDRDYPNEYVWFSRKNGRLAKNQK